MNLNKPIYAILIVVLTAIIIDISLKNWEKQDRVIEHDVHSYYFYLPALFIYDDIHLQKSDYQFSKNYLLFWTGPDEQGNKVAKMTSGLSILYAPFFFMAHLVATFSNYPQNGFSEPYKLFLLIGALFYLFIGLDFLHKTLKLYSFSDKHVSVTILLIGLGTNLLAYSSQSGTMSHVYSFALFSGFIYNTIKWYNNTSSHRYIIWLGLLLGLISLIRPTNGLIVLFFIFYGIASFSALKERIFLFKKKFFLLSLVIPLILLVWSPQLWYWKEVSGNFLYYSYREEGFYFLDPKIIEGLFSFRKGWLIYTPMMILAITGLFFLCKEAKKARTAIIVFSVINIYVIFSWWCWWYGGSFGQRTLIDSYAVWAIPLAAFVQFIDKKKWITYSFYGLGLFFIWLNIFQTYQFEYQCLHYDSMSRKAYFKQFGILHRKSDYYEFIDNADYDAAQYRKKKGRKGMQKKKDDDTRNKIKKREQISLVAKNGKYLCTEANKNIIANRERIDTLEKFTLLLFENEDVAFLSYDSNYLAIEIDKRNELTATRTARKDWETFKLEYLGNNFIAIKACNEKYLSLDSESLRIFASSDTIGENEKFNYFSIN